MLSIKAICKSENNEEVMIIGFELEGYCLCMTKSGTIFHAKHEDLTIVDKEYMESCAKGSIDFEMADFLEKASARLDQTQSKQLTSIILELQEYRSKIEQGTLIELPCKVGDTVYKIMHVCGKRRIVQFEVSRISIYEKEICVFFHKSKESWHEWCTKPHHFGGNIFLTREEAEKRLKELQE